MSATLSDTAAKSVTSKGTAIATPPASLIWQAAR